MDKKDLVGKVIHYYDKIGVAIVRLEKVLKAGDKVKFSRGDDGFEQVVESMQIEHAAIEEGKPKQEVGIKVNQPVHEGMLVYLA
ncbi:MAG: hypothetical protein HYS68_00895 [Candidatus Levybacteria bacterium]|nr:hypothetical protein [Candidatus Levybacteria bacterium]